MIFGKKKKTDDKKETSGEPQLPNLEIKAAGVPKEEAVGLLIACRQLPGYPLAVTLLANAINDRPTAFEVAPNPEALKMALKGINVSQPGII